MVKPDLEDLIASLNNRYWVCEKCDESFPTKEETEKHEEKCMLHGTDKINQTPRTKSIVLQPHNLLFVLGIFMLLLTLIVPEPSSQDIISDCVGDDLSEPEDVEKCTDKLELQLTLYKWMFVLSHIFIFVGLYNTIRERMN